MRKLTIAVGVLVLSGVVLAQTSTSFKLEEYTLNAGGTPSQGVDLSSASPFSITLASIGDSVAASGLSSTSFQMDVGFDAAYPPPGEVANRRSSSILRGRFSWAATSNRPPRRFEPLRASMWQSEKNDAGGPNRVCLGQSWQRVSCGEI